MSTSTPALEAGGSGGDAGATEVQVMIGSGRGGAGGGAQATAASITPATMITKPSQDTHVDRIAHSPR